MFVAAPPHLGLAFRTRSGGGRLQRSARSHGSEAPTPELARRGGRCFLIGDGWGPSGPQANQSIRGHKPPSPCGMGSFGNRILPPGASRVQKNDGVKARKGAGSRKSSPGEKAAPIDPDLERLMPCVVLGFAVIRRRRAGKAGIDLLCCGWARAVVGQLVGWVT